jgi:hypothetical protein
MNGLNLKTSKLRGIDDKHRGQGYNDEYVSALDWNVIYVVVQSPLPRPHQIRWRLVLPPSLPSRLLDFVSCSLAFI